MKTKIIPDNKKIVQGNYGELLSNLFASFNIDLQSNRGKIRVSPKTYIYNAKSTNSDTATLKYPSAFVRSSANGTDSYWILCDKQLIRVDASSDASWGSLAVDTSTSTPTSILGYKVSDMVDWGGYLYVSGSTDIVRLPGNTTWASWWNALSGNPLLTQDIPHPLCVGFNNLFLCGDGTGVVYSDTLGTFSKSRLTFKSQFEVLWIISSSTEYWIGCRNKKGGQGEVFMWDGVSQNFNSNYKIGSEIPLAGIIKDNVCYVLNNIGQLLAFNGSGFSEVARLPIANYREFSWIDQTAGNDIFTVHKNGMTLINNNINILVNSNLNAYTSNLLILEEMPSGIWEYTPENGLVHKYSITKDIANLTTNDYGSPIITFAGFIYPYNKTYSSFIAGGAVGTTHMIFREDSADSIAKCGYIITPLIQTREVQENWQKMFFNIKQLLNSTDKIRIKYRTYKKAFGVGTYRGEQLALEYTWVDSTHLSIAATTAQLNLAVGDEIEIMTGIGAGLSANITAITGTSTITLTIDETVSGASGTCTARLANWTDIGQSITTQGLEWFKFPLALNSAWVQFKIVMLWKGKNEIEKIIIKSDPQINIV